MLHSTVSTVDEIVRVGMLIEEDFQAAKKYWCKQPANAYPHEERSKTGPTNPSLLNVPLTILSVQIQLDSYRVSTEKGRGDSPVHRLQISK